MFFKRNKFKLHDIVLNELGDIGRIIDVTADFYVVNFITSDPSYYDYFTGDKKITNCFRYNKNKSELLHKINLTNFINTECLKTSFLDYIKEKLKIDFKLDINKADNAILIFNCKDGEHEGNENNTVYAYDQKTNVFHYFNEQFDNFYSKDCFKALDLLTTEIKKIELLKEQENTIQINDYVRISNLGQVYMCYNNWKGLTKYKKLFKYGYQPLIDNVYKVINIDSHETDCTTLALIQDIITQQVYIINVQGLKKINVINENETIDKEIQEQNIISTIKTNKIDSCDEIKKNVTRDTIETKNLTESDFGCLTANQENNYNNKNECNNKYCFKKGDKVKIKDWNKIYPDYEDWQGFENDTQLKEIWSGKFKSTLSTLKYFPNKNKTYIIKKIKQHNRTDKNLAFIVDEYCNINDYYDMNQILEEYKNKNDNVNDSVGDNVNDWLKKYNLSMLKPEFKINENGESYLNFTLCTPLGWIIDVDSLEKVEE